MLEVSRSTTRLFDHMATLLAHPLQRPKQRDTHYLLTAREEDENQWKKTYKILRTVRKLLVLSSKSKNKNFLEPQYQGKCGRACYWKLISTLILYSESKPIVYLLKKNIYKNKHAKTQEGKANQRNQKWRSECWRLTIIRDVFSWFRRCTWPDHQAIQF